MLIGPTLTLEQLEKHMDVQIAKNENELVALTRELNIAKDKLNTMRKYTRDEEGNEIVDPEYTKLANDFQSNLEKYEALNDSITFIKAKINEIEELEHHTNGQFDKTKEKITLTLDDCVILGVEMDDEK